MSLLRSTLRSVLQRQPSPPAGEAKATDAATVDTRTGPALESTGADGNPLLDYFLRNGGRVIHKWVDYFEVYHHALARFRGRPIKFLEIGVQNGGSARMWQDYLGPQARIIGVDIDPQCRSLEAEGFEIWIGDQADPAFWAEVTQAHDSFDVILDDGGHTMEQQIRTFQALFPVLAPGGVYLCEDTHTSYFPAHGGGLRRQGTFHEYVKGLIDEMHAWYHAPVGQLQQGHYMAHHLRAISIFDSIVLFEKRRRNAPLAIARGSEAHAPAPPAMTYLDMRRAFGVPD